MNKLYMRLAILAIVVGITVLLVPALAVQANPPTQGGIPTIPHTLDGRAQCLACHEKGIGGAIKAPPDHAGRTNEMCQACHKPGTATTKAPATSATPAPATAGGIPQIPHPLEGRENCLVCHQAGVGGAPKVPANHAGRTSEQCEQCHKSKAVAPVVVPTQIAHPPASASQNSCVDCHQQQTGKSADIVKQWTSSIHSTRGVTCADCHGGDATKSAKDTAHATSAGYVGKTAMQNVPALCASCHSRVDLMRQYDKPTDQYAQYQDSIHGLKLALGDKNVATCFICHDQHGTKEVKDPTSNVYPMNVPKLCSGCHSNVVLMKTYGIPTNQFDLYRKSVHGIALLDKQDPRAPSCATCHGFHGAAPPGFSEVANVCGSCHSATQDYFLKSKHAGNTPGTPKCVTCHGRYDIGPASEAMFTGTDTRGCASCHAGNSPQSTAVKQLYDAITASATEFANAGKAVDRASGTGLIMAPEQTKLADAKTNLITARAAQHTLNFDTVKAKTDKSIAVAKEIQADAQKATDESIFRRQAMVIGLVVLAMAVFSLYLIRRELYRALPPKD